MANNNGKTNSNTGSKQSLLYVNVMEDPRYYSLLYKNMINEKVVLLVNNPNTYSLYEFHKEIKKKVIITYFTDVNSLINPQFYFDIKKLINDEFEVFKTKYFNNLEIQLEKNFSEIYSKHLGLKTEFDLESLFKKWKSLENEFFLSVKESHYESATESIIKHTILQKNKNIRFFDNLRKIIKSFESPETIDSIKQNLKVDYEKKLNEYKKQLENISEKNIKFNSNNKLLEMTLKGKFAELEIYKDKIEKQDMEMDNFRREEDKKYNESSMRNSKMFYINTTNQKSPKCTESCIIF